MCAHWLTEYAVSPQTTTFASASEPPQRPHLAVLPPKPSSPPGSTSSPRCSEAISSRCSEITASPCFEAISSRCSEITAFFRFETSLARRDGSEVPVGRVAVPKTGQKNASPGCAAIDLHEIHLAPQSSLQVPVGHIPVPGGIKLCSPGTFLVANYLIINNGSCQGNFTKPNRAAIRYTNSQWLPEEVTEAPVGEVAVPKSGRSIDQRPV